MIIIDTQPQVLSSIKVDVTVQDLEQKIKTLGNSPEILKIAERTLGMVKGTWKPKTVYQWFEFQNAGRNNIGNIIQNHNYLANFDFGYSIKFLTPARYALISVYTAGQELEQKSNISSSKGDLLEAYLIDYIGLIVLDKARLVVKQIAEEQAETLRWGVSPFLSPGSVHGWNLEEQIKLCSLLPLEKINVKIRDDAVLSPFKTVSCLIGVGPGYDAAQVGTTCQVCSKNNDCQMKKEEEPKC